ncbi:MAG: polyprenyl diphosphate synthase [Candidatus Hydrogenedentales bacterium]
MATHATKEQLDPNRLPRHVAIIMDGNGRWAKRRGVTRAQGHEAGANSVRAAIEACRELQRIEILSLYAFSTENWRRTKTEVNTLFRLLSKHIRLEIENLHKENIRVMFTGRRNGLAAKVLADMESSESMTAGNGAMTLNVAINYGGRTELVDVCRRIAADTLAGKLAPESIDEDTIAERLYLPEGRDVDLLIRTSGEWRLSNFMLWQMSYSEIYVTETLWPDFRKPHLYDALADYQQRERRFGGR